ncbi:dTDP-4-dehydrorhamnose 3,5-epimerase [Vibrio nigripulchritudo]|uniref:dTDP-4-dehydrorhamnose 3,5-epimerase n=1 Tax=Vibrio nigripulchritudo TaxID=28173 RepID=UPI0005F9D5EA|nr:dTDP-4-dehydrorhamnose 3,5-epimerase [Vibrio nigripulchritudo]KJY79062.1 dTDP-4-dehydrorhamnose 3,5-epimerase [Vibrio nigripulchritudo]
MKVKNTKIEGLILLEPEVHGDKRGFFMESYHEDKYHKAGIREKFVQDNRSKSRKNVLRGLHYQKEKPQGKLVSVLDGKIFDVAVDLRLDSKTFGMWESFILSSSNNYQLYIPPGFAHGFCVLSEQADFIYKCTEFYSPQDECGLVWNDKTLNIKWPVDDPIISEKDALLPSFLGKEIIINE